jgi:putative oxidoreductase
MADRLLSPVLINYYVSFMAQTSPATRPAVGAAANTALWVLQALLAVAFVVPVYRKLAGLPESVQLFDDIGLGQWLRYAVGLLELALAIGLVFPRLAGPAALGLVGVMAGAIATELWFETGMWPLPSALLVVAALVAWGRRDQTATLLRRPTPPPAAD